MQLRSVFKHLAFFIAASFSLLSFVPRAFAGDCAFDLPSISSFEPHSPDFGFTADFSSALVSDSNHSDSAALSGSIDFVAFDSDALTGEKLTIKNYLAGISGMLFVNLFLVTWNRYMIGSGWAKVGPDEWNKFWERDLEWDTDWYWTNFVLHPYQGGLYYMSARGAGLNQFGSFVVTLAGSAFWEYFCETNAPSKNDFVYTSVGSFAVGEMLYRLSAEATQINKLFSAALNPARLWTENLWKIEQPSLYTSGNIHELYVAFSLGTVATDTDIPNYSGNYTENEYYPVFVMPEIKVVYNDPYRHSSNIPYKQFDLEVKAGAGAGSGHAGECEYPDIDEKLFYNINITSSGMLFSRTLDLSDNIDTSLGAVLEYDFDWHSFYELSSLALGGAVKQRIYHAGHRFEWQFHLAGIVLGTTDYYYYHRDLVEYTQGTLRAYSYTTGIQNVLNFRYVAKKGTTFEADFRGYAMYDFYDQKQHTDIVTFEYNGEKYKLRVDDYECPTGWEYIGHLTNKIEVPMSKIIRLGGAYELYMKHTFYRHKNDVTQFVNTFKGYVKF